MVENGAISTPTIQIGYAVGLDSQVYKTTNGGGAPYVSSVFTPKPCDCSTMLSPNPATQHVVLTFDPVDRVRDMDVFDVVGRLVERLRIPWGTATYELDIRALASGPYVVRLGSGCSRFIKL
jgi:hypothetical protein